jgi:hypothetical protein
VTAEEAVKRALEEPTLAAALAWVAIWENDRAVQQALRGDRGFDGRLWDTCFEMLFKRVLEGWRAKVERVEQVDPIPPRPLPTPLYPEAWPDSWQAGATMAVIRAISTEIQRLRADVARLMEG